MKGEGVRAHISTNANDLYSLELGWKFVDFMRPSENVWSKSSGTASAIKIDSEI